MIPATFTGFIETLIKATSDRKVEWQEGAYEESFFCAHKDYNLHLSHRFDEDRQIGVYSFSIVREGKSTGFSVRDDEADYTEMGNLFSAVSANATGLDRIGADFFD